MPAAPAVNDQATPAGLAEFSDVQRGFRLGWRFAEMYNDPPPHIPPADDPKSLPENLPGAAELPGYHRAKLLVNQMRYDVEGLTRPAQHAEDGDIKTFFEVAGAGGDRDTTRLLILKAYRELRTRLGGADPLVGKALDLGKMLADTVLLQKSQDPGISLDQLEPHRLADAYGCLDDLHTSLPVNAADAVKGSLRQWEAWQADSKSNGAAEDTGYAIAVLKHQGEIWRRILSGEIGAEDLLTAEHYRQAAARLIGRLRNLSVSFLKRWWYIAIILLFSVGLITWAIVAYAPSGPAAVAALIATGAGALGVSWKTVGAGCVFFRGRLFGVVSVMRRG